MLLPISFLSIRVSYLHSMIIHPYYKMLLEWLKMAFFLSSIFQMLKLDFSFVVSWESITFARGNPVELDETSQGYMIILYYILIRCRIVKVLKKC